jgi:hypothetical protein
MVRVVGGMHGWMTGCDARQEEKSKVKSHKEKNEGHSFCSRKNDTKWKGGETAYWYGIEMTDEFFSLRERKGPVIVRSSSSFLINYL